MNASMIRKAVKDLTVRGPQIRGLLGARCATWLSALMFGSLPTVALAQSPCHGVHVKILGIRNSTGGVACALFESPEGFPTEYLRSATNIMVIKVREKQARCDFEDIPPGTYALAVVHDENMNGNLTPTCWASPRKATVFPMTQRPCSAHRHSQPPASRTTGRTWS